MGQAKMRRDSGRGEWERLEDTMGPCECPEIDGKRPHKEDTFGYKSRLLFGDWRKIGAAQPDMKTAVLIMQAMTDWTLTDEDGEPLPISIEVLDALSLRQSSKLVNLLDNPKYTMASFGIVPDPNPASPSPTASESTTVVS